MAERTFKTGEIIFRPGDPGDFAYLIQAGEVELLSGPPEKLRRVTHYGKDDVFGEMSLIQDRQRTMTARAVTAGSALTMTRSEFENLLMSDPAKCRKYLRSLFERLRTTINRLEEAGYQETPVPPMPKVTLLGLTQAAKDSLPAGGLTIPKFPYRIGRAPEADEPEAWDLNDMWLNDAAPFNVSRNHLALELGGEGEIVVADRGSHLGTLVNDAPLGRVGLKSRIALQAGENTLTVGGRQSPFQFRVTVA